MNANDNADSIFEYCCKADEAERQFEIFAPLLSWAMLAALEPKFAELFTAAPLADAGRRDEYFCGQHYWHNKLKPQMLPLVGPSRPDFHPVLGTSAAYDLAYDTLQGALPPCRQPCPWCDAE